MVGQLSVLTVVRTAANSCELEWLAVYFNDAVLVFGLSNFP